MRKLPAIGQRVKYRHALELSDRTEIRECTGTVDKLYPTYREPTLVPVKDESKWHAAVIVDEPLPAWWPYPGTNRFAPVVGELTAIKGTK